MPPDRSNSSAFPKLLAPIALGRHVLRNRLVMGSMHTRLESLDDGLRRHVVLFEFTSRIGGQLVLASAIPGKQEFRELLRYFQRQIELTGVEVRLCTTASAYLLRGFDHVVVATGVEPHRPDIGGIGFDVAELLLTDAGNGVDFYEEWGVDVTIQTAGGLQTPKKLASTTGSRGN